MSEHIELAYKHFLAGLTWVHTYPLIQAAAKEVLADLPADGEIGITPLVKQLSDGYPRAFRDVVFKALKGGARGKALKDWSFKKSAPDRYRPGRTMSVTYFRSFTPATVADKLQELDDEVQAAVARYEVLKSLSKQVGEASPFHEIEQDFLARAIEIEQERKNGTT